jgi:hypothetical protein
MCVGCFVVSAFTLFLPPTDLPQAPGASYSALPPQVEVQQLRSAVAEMKAAIPSAPETSLLREELGTLLVELNGTKDLEETELLLEDGFQNLRDQILASPEADRLMEVLYQIREERFRKNQTLSSLLDQPVRRWGWLG